MATLTSLGYVSLAMAGARPDGLARREALLDAALACFDAQGLLRTGIEDIRKAAGASPSSVYHLFKDLPALIAALLERTFIRRYGQVTTAVLATKTPKAAVHALVESHLDWVFANLAEARFMYQALALELDGTHRAELRASKQRLKADLVTHLVELGVFSRNDAPETMIDVVLLGPTNQACRSYFTAPNSVDVAWMRKMLPELAWQSVKKS